MDGEHQQGRTLQVSLEGVTQRFHSGEDGYINMSNGTTVGRVGPGEDSQFLQIRHSSNTFGNSFSPTTATELNAVLSSLFHATR